MFAMTQPEKRFATGSSTKAKFRYVKGAAQGGSLLQSIRMIYHFDVSGILETWKLPSDVELLNVERALSFTFETIRT